MVRWLDGLIGCSFSLFVNWLVGGLGCGCVGCSVGRLVGCLRVGGWRVGFGVGWTIVWV